MSVSPIVFEDARLNGEIRRLDERIDAAAPTVDGTAVDWPGDLASLPAGLLPLDGRAVSRTACPGLFAAYGVRFGPGDGRTTFNLPRLAMQPGLLRVTRAG